jgi:phosphoribosylaminoimidazolecarboxamide formyltransferase/IMP cyclohydrolase
MKDAILASDAFFPFSDIVEMGAQAGIRTFVQPGGSVKDEESIAMANQLGVVMVFTGTRHFRH